MIDSLKGWLTALLEKLVPGGIGAVVGYLSSEFGLLGKLLALVL